MDEKKKLTVKCSSEELQAWKDAAYVRRTSLSEWVRLVLTATAAAHIADSSRG